MLCTLHAECSTRLITNQIHSHSLWNGAGAKLIWMYKHNEKVLCGVKGQLSFVECGERAWEWGYILDLQLYMLSQSGLSIHTAWSLLTFYSDQVLQRLYVRVLHVNIHMQTSSKVVGTWGMSQDVLLVYLTIAFIDARWLKGRRGCGYIPQVNEKSDKLLVPVYTWHLNLDWSGLIWIDLDQSELIVSALCAQLASKWIDSNHILWM